MESLVSCLCVTVRRSHLLPRAVACFRRQTYGPRELVILFEADDPSTRAYLETLRDPNIRLIEAPIGHSLLLGDLRNVAIGTARGEYIAQWDDDDWYAPERLAVQMEAIAASGRPACVLERLTLFDTTTGVAYLAPRYPWEGSLVARRDDVPPYPPLSRREDTPVIRWLYEHQQLVFIDRPELYIYTHHGANTWPSEHFYGMAKYAEPLPDVDGHRIADLLASAK